jgi:hypothetical protein
VASSFDHLVGAGEQRRRQVEAERLRVLRPASRGAPMNDQSAEMVHGHVTAGHRSAGTSPSMSLTKTRGVVVHVFRDRMLADIRVVRFGAANDGIAVPVSSIRRYRTAPIAQRRRGGK